MYLLVINILIHCDVLGTSMSDEIVTEFRLRMLEIVAETPTAEQYVGYNLPLSVRAVAPVPENRGCSMRVTGRAKDASCLVDRDAVLPVSCCPTRASGRAASDRCPTGQLSRDYAITPRHGPVHGSREARSRHCGCDEK